MAVKDRAARAHIHAIEVERLDPKPLNMRASGFKRVEDNSLHLSRLIPAGIP